MSNGCSQEGRTLAIGLANMGGDATASSVAAFDQSLSTGVVARFALTSSLSSSRP